MVSENKDGERRLALDAFRACALRALCPMGWDSGIVGPGVGGHVGFLRLFKDIQPVQLTTIHQPRLERPDPIHVHVHCHRRRRRRRPPRRR